MPCIQHQSTTSPTLRFNVQHQTAVISDTDAVSAYFYQWRCPEISFLLGCQSGKLESKKTAGVEDSDFRAQYQSNTPWLSVMSDMWGFNSFNQCHWEWLIHSKVEEGVKYDTPLGVIFHPNRQILEYWSGGISCHAVTVCMYSLLPVLSFFWLRFQYPDFQCNHNL